MEEPCAAEAPGKEAEGSEGSEGEGSEAETGGHEEIWEGGGGIEGRRIAFVSHDIIAMRLSSHSVGLLQCSLEKDGMYNHIPHCAREVISLISVIL